MSKETNFPLELPEGKAALPTPWILAPQDLCLASDPQKQNKLVLS